MDKEFEEPVEETKPQEESEKTAAKPFKSQRKEYKVPEVKKVDVAKPEPLVPKIKCPQCRRTDTVTKQTFGIKCKRCGFFPWEQVNG